MPSIFWWPLIAAALHITEEFFWPGGFPDWDRAHRPEIAASITPRLHIVVNAALLFACLSVALNTPNKYVVVAWLTIAALLASNAIWHIAGAIRTRRYSPGMITGTLLYIPMMVYGYAHFLKSGDVNVPSALVAFAIGGSYHWWSPGIHRLRARGKA